MLLDRFLMWYSFLSPGAFFSSFITLLIILLIS